MNPEMTVTFQLNGETATMQAQPQQSLLQMLRGHGVWEVKCACGEGDCGSCTVLLAGRAVKSCLIPALSCREQEVWTIGGLGEQDSLTQLLQAAFVQQGAVQCGFCTPGMILTARDYLVRGGSGEREQIRRALSGNLCRCTGYEKIIQAVQQAAQAYAPKEVPLCPKPDSA